MIKTIAIPKTNSYQLDIPASYIGKEIEILFYAVDEVSKEKGVEQKKTMADFWGTLSDKTADELQKAVAESRDSWEGRLKKQLWTIMYLLDTNAVIDFCNAKLPSNAKKLLSEIDPAISVITRIELFASNKIPDEEKRVLEGFISISTVYDNINEAIVSRAISIRQQHNIKLPDSIIAATALAYNRILISRNTNDFQNIGDLQLINPYAL